MVMVILAKWMVEGAGAPGWSQVPLDLTVKVHDRVDQGLNARNVQQVGPFLIVQLNPHLIQGVQHWLDPNHNVNKIVETLVHVAPC
jgi:hypothetical protein